MIEWLAREILGVKPGADLAAIKAAFRRLIKIHHSDRTKKSDEAAKRIIEAYRTLTNGVRDRAAADGDEDNAIYPDPDQERAFDDYDTLNKFLLVLTGIPEAAELVQKIKDFMRGIDMGYYNYLYASRLINQAKAAFYAARARAVNIF